MTVAVFHITVIAGLVLLLLDIGLLYEQQDRALSHKYSFNSSFRPSSYYHCLIGTLFGYGL